MITIKIPRSAIRFFSLSAILVGCGINPQNADIGLDETLPEAKVTVYQKAIDQLGLMSSIFTDAPLKIMTKDIMDNTGTSTGTSFEIPRDITEMVKSTLNSIGGNVLYIPYETEFMLNTANTGYSDYGDKILPKVILSGGITEFDRGLVTKGDGSDIDIAIGREYGINFSDNEKSSLASVTLDFNLIDFKTFTGIPRIQAVNGIKLHKATREDSIGFTIKSVTFGARGEIKKVQGRHAAIRLLVQLSMLQIVGRYQKLPYWQLIPNAERDNVVIDQVLADFYALTKPQMIAKTQELLYLHGYAVTPNGQLDNPTQTALRDFAQNRKLGSATVDQTLYLALYETVPVTASARQRRKNLSSGAMQSIIAETPNTQPQAVSQQTPAQQQNVPTQTTPASPAKSKGSLSVLTDKSSYNIGDKLHIKFSVTEPMYVRMVVINSKGNIDTLFPNPYQSDNFCKPGREYSIPYANADFSLDIGGPAGVDKIRAIASDKPIPANALLFTEDGKFDDNKMAGFQIRAAVDYTIR